MRKIMSRKLIGLDLIFHSLLSCKCYCYCYALRSFGIFIVIFEFGKLKANLKKCKLKYNSGEAVCLLVSRFCSSFRGFFCRFCILPCFCFQPAAWPVNLRTGNSTIIFFLLKPYVRMTFLLYS